MGIIRLLTRRHLSVNKGRTAVTIMGIAVSVAMITAVFIAAASFFNFFGEIALIADGDAEATFENINSSKLASIRTDDRIEKVGLVVKDNAESAFVLESDGSRRIRIGNIYTADETNLEQMISCGYEGTLPTNSSQVAVEENFLIRNGLEPVPGQEITVELGHRTWVNGDGKVETYQANYQDTEMWDSSGEATFTVTAVLRNNPGTSRYKMIRGISAEEMAAYTGPLNAMISMKKVDHRTSGIIDDMALELGVEKYTRNDDYLDSKLCIRANSGFAAMLPLLLIILAIIITASVVLIYNAFSMSLTERVKYLGMLSSVGATRWQKKYSVYYEGFLLALAGIPLGFAAGTAGISVTLKVVNHLMSSSGIIPALEENPDLASLHTVIPPVLIPVIILFSLISIAAAAFVPARKASKIMPIDAIRQTTEIRIRGRKIRCPGYISRIFGYEGELAYKNMKRSPAKSRIITMSITASVILFLSVTSFCHLFWESNGDSFFIPFDIIASAGYQNGNELLVELEEVPEIDEVYLANMIIYEFKRGDEDTADLSFINPENIEKKYRDMYSDRMNVDLRMLSDEDFKLLCENNGLDVSKYYGDTIKAAICNTVTYDGKGQDVFTDRLIGQVLRYDDPDKGPGGEIEIADFVKWEDNEHLYGMYAKNRVTAFVPMSTYAEVLYHGDYPEGFTMDLAIKTDQQSLVYAKVEDIMDSGNYSDTFVENISDDVGTMTVVAYILQIFTYGFIFLIMLIAVATIINSISTGIKQRRKEFAMLKSVGMTQKGFMKMIRLETLLYGIRSILVGIPVSILISYVMTTALKYDIPFSLDLVSYIEVTAAVFIILALTKTASVSALKGQSIIGTLKEDIL